MAKVKISELENSLLTTPADTLMVVTGGKNKKMTLETLLANLNSTTTINSQRTTINFTVNGTQPNLLVTKASTNKVGIGGIANPESSLHVAGNIQIGGNVGATTKISSVAVGDNDTAGTGYKRVTVTTDTSHGYLTGNAVDIYGLNIAAMTGTFAITGVSSGITFTYKIANSVNTSTLNTSPSVATATVNTFREGVLRLSAEDMVIASSTTETLTIAVSHSYTALSIPSDIRFTLPVTTLSYIEKTVYLKSCPAGSTASIENINGLGFSKVVLPIVGSSATFFFNGSKWVITGSYAATVS